VAGEIFLQSDHEQSEIVISGAALITSLGSHRNQVWQAVLAGRCGVSPATLIESPIELPGSAGAECGQAVELDDRASADEAHLPREARYLRRALTDALADAGFARQAGGLRFGFPYPRHRRALLMGTTLHGMRQGGAFLRGGDSEVLRHFLSTAVLQAASHGLGLEGPALSTCSACSSSLSSMALGATLLQSGHADLVIAGGYDPISEYSYAGFNSLRIVALGPLRPFARDRQGMKVGEGYGVLVMERAADAARRGAPVLAAIAGFGESADAYHLTQPDPQGQGAARAMTQALQSAGLQPADIDLIAAHATGTPDNDAAEYAALSRTFGPHLGRVPVVGFKSHLSHALGAAGAVELILSAMALSSRVVPPCANVTEQDTDFADLRLGAGTSRPAPLRHTMNMSLGFGGANACMILGPPGPKAISPRRRKVFISGVGVVLPGAIGNQAFLARLADAAAARVACDAAEMDEERIAAILSARRIRRMSGYVKLAVASATLALADAGVNDLADFCSQCCAILASTHGGARYCENYYREIIHGGISAANPMLFAEGVPNAASAHLSLATGMTGSCQTIIGSRTGGLDALGLAALRIADGSWDRAVVAAADEYSPLVNAGYAHCRLYAPREPTPPFCEASDGTFVTGWGAAGLVLESEQSLARRGAAAARGVCLGYAAGSGEIAHLSAVAGRVLAELSDPSMIVSSANGTWLDRVEAAGLRLSARRTGQPAAVSSLCGHVAECFSAGPLAAIAAVLLSGGLPRMFSSAAAPAGAANDFAALACDYNGLVAGVRVQRLLPGDSCR
jgi:3-oxoacyl-[acyl-carrier-protein] synthase II